MMHATKGGMEQREFPVPPIETQRQIVGLASKLFFFHPHGRNP